MLSEMPKLSIRRGAGFCHLGEDGLAAQLVLKQHAKGFGTSRGSNQQRGTDSEKQKGCGGSFRESWRGATWRDGWNLRTIESMPDDKASQGRTHGH